ncbi:MAG: DUF4145 domain-containing protein [Desulfurococcaceae archaeon]|nr:DUF4145 domain-containing protein [Desulfurococcaceae archaeon]
MKEGAENSMNIKETVEGIPEDYVKNVKTRMLRDIIDNALRSMDVSVEEWVNTVRESRFER